MNNYELIESYAKKGESHNIMSALTLLTEAYIDQCGVSLGYRTVIYTAAEQWLERLAWLDLPLSEMARKEALVTVMPHITSDYDPEEYDDYDIAGMNKEELMDGCVEMIRSGEYDEVTNELLCWGILKAVNEELVIHKEIETVAPDGTLLKGVLTNQSRAWTSIRMESPYGKVSLGKPELIRDAEAFMIQGYEDCKRIKRLESEIRALYPKYQEKLSKLDGESNWKKRRIFKIVYGEILGDTVICSPEMLFNKCILHQTVYDELKTLIDSHDVKPCSFIWNPNKDFNIYNEPYKDGYGVYLGKCLRYYVEDKAVADKICEILKKDLANFVLGRYPTKQRTDE